MTNDELEAVRARVERLPATSDNAVKAIAASCLDLLDEVERLRSRAAPDPCEPQVPFDTPDGVTWFPGPLGGDDPFDRATRAEAHAERLSEISVLAEDALTKAAFETGSMASAETFEHVRDQLRQALSAYRGEMNPGGGG